MSPPGERLARSWTGNAAAWIEAVRGGRIQSRWLANDAAMLDALLALKPARVPEVGCSEGWLCRALATHAIETVGVGASAPRVEAARAAGGGRFDVLTYANLGAAAERLGTFDALACKCSAAGPGHPAPAATWLAERAAAGFQFERLREPAHPDTARPLSLLLETRA